MILSQLTEYLAEHKQAPLVDLSYRLEATPEALRGMLAVLERKGRVRKLPAGTPCGGGCSRCAPQTVEVYQWIGD